MVCFSEGWAGAWRSNPHAWQGPGTETVTGQCSQFLIPLPSPLMTECLELEAGLWAALELKDSVNSDLIPVKHIMSQVVGTQLPHVKLLGMVLGCQASLTQSPINMDTVHL